MIYCFPEGGSPVMKTPVTILSASAILTLAAIFMAASPAGAPSQVQSLPPDFPRPRLVSLKMEDAALNEVMQKISEPYAPNLKLSFADRIDRVSVQFNNVPLWEALQTLGFPSNRASILQC